MMNLLRWVNRLMGVLMPKAKPALPKRIPSKTAYGLIRAFEGLRLTAYQDMVGVWTIGYGTTGSDVKAGMVIDALEANRRLYEQIDWLADRLGLIIPLSLNQNQFDALLSFCYNLGLGAYKGSMLKKFIDSGNYSSAAEEFGKWVFAGRRNVPGLVRRREAERELFCRK